MRVLPDLTQKRKLRPQHAGTLTVVARSLAPGQRRPSRLVEGCLPTTTRAPRFESVVKAKQLAHVQGASEWSEAHSRPQKLASERQRPDGWPVVRRPERRQRRPLVPYRPKDGSQAGPLFWIYCRHTGAKLHSCRGVIHYVLAEAEKFAQAQGGTLADVEVRIDAE